MSARMDCELGRSSESVMGALLYPLVDLAEPVENRPTAGNSVVGYRRLRLRGLLSNQGGAQPEV